MPARPLRIMDTDRSSISSVVDTLANEPRLALDTESDPFHRYFEKVCLIQISTSEEDFVLDPLALGLPSELRAVLSDPKKTWVLHGADYDVRSLRRSFDVVLGRLFDTLVAALLLGEKALGLKALLARKLGVEIEKGEQRSDWGRRPLSALQLEYARQDTMHLLPLASELGRAVEAAGRLAWLEEECENLRTVDVLPRAFDPEGWRKLKGARGLGPVGRRALRGAYRFREEEAMARDRPPFRILRSETMVAIAARVDRDGLMDARSLRRERSFPRTLDPAGLVESMRASIEGSGAPAGAVGEHDRARGGLGATPEEDLETRRHAPPDVEVRIRLDRLRAARAGWAKALGLDPGFLIASSVLERLAREPPRAAAELRAVRGMTAWRVEAIGDPLLSVLGR